MSEQEFNAVFSKRLRYYLSKHEMTQVELAKKLGVGTTSVYNWCNGIKTPRMDKVDAMCELFHCKRSDLINEKDESDDHYYLNDETRQIAQEAFENPELRLLIENYKSVPCDMQKRLIAYAGKLRQLHEDEYLLNAAHERTDIKKAEFTQEARQHDDDIMDDPNF